MRKDGNIKMGIPDRSYRTVDCDECDGFYMMHVPSRSIEFIGYKEHKKNTIIQLVIIGIFCLIMIFVSLFFLFF
jgi:hypothetical protein